MTPLMEMERGRTVRRVVRRGRAAGRTSAWLTSRVATAWIVLSLGAFEVVLWILAHHGNENPALACSPAPRGPQISHVNSCLPTVFAQTDFVAVNATLLGVVVMAIAVTWTIGKLRGTRRPLWERGLN
jgi:hypothetical protein